MVDPHWKDCGPQLVAALRAAWQSRSERDWRETAPETHALIVAAIHRYERAANKYDSAVGCGAFLRNRFGKNWVLARRTSGIVSRYGADVTCLSQARLDKAEADYLDGAKP